MSGTTDVAVIGAGPAGLSAAVTAADAGLAVVIVDNQPDVGGQVYRGIRTADNRRCRILGQDYAAGRALLGTLERARVCHIAGASVWEVTPDRQIFYSRGGEAAVLRARHIVLCTGAVERPMPFPGWTMPGVMTAGAGQILLKTSGIVPPSPTVLAGSGPLLVLVAVQYLRAGHPIAAIVETTPMANLGRAIRLLPGAVRESSYIRKGLALLGELKRRRVRHYKRASTLRALGEEQIATVRFRVGAREHEIACATLLIHNGVVPNVQITRALGLEHIWEPLPRCWRPRLGNWGETTIEGIAVAGDGGGIAGVEASVHRGRIAGLHAARRLDALSAEAAKRRVLRERRRLARHEAARPFLDALYAPAPALLVPSDETIVCRCEEVTAGAIREQVTLGCLGPNQLKAFVRAGMGPCQGRLCGLSVSETIADARGVPVEDVGYYRIRPPISPVTLGEIASAAP